MNLVFLKLAFLLYFVALVLYLLVAARLGPRRALHLLARLSFVVAVGLHAVFLGQRWYFMGHPPLNSMFDAMGVTVFFLALVTLLFEVFTGAYQAVPVSLILVSIAGYVLLYKSNPQPVPLMPALMSYWFYIHVPITIFSYAFFGMAFMYDLSYYLFRFLRRSEYNPRYTKNLIFWGFLLLTAGIFTGSAWANEAWGSYWAWDPKEVWSLITWSLYLIYLHLEFHPSLKRYAFLMNLIAFSSIFMTFLGVNWLTKIFSVESMHTYM